MRRRQIPLTALAVVLMTSATLWAETRSTSRPIKLAGSSSYGGKVGYAPTIAGNDCCSGCNICCPNLIPAVLNGIDCMLNKLFCCDPCCTPCCPDPCATSLLWSQRSKGPVGCDAPMNGRITPPNPFMDDPQVEIVAPQAASHSRLRTTGRPIGYRTVKRGKGKMSIYGTNAPRTLSIRKAEPIKAAKTASATRVDSKQSTVRVASSNSGDLQVPPNPLRD